MDAEDYEVCGLGSLQCYNVITI